MRGVNSLTINCTLGATDNAIFSEFFTATDLGVISPKIKTNNVTIPVAIPTPVLPNNSMLKEVAIEEAKIFTKLLPTKIELNSLFGSSIKDRTILAFLLPSSDKCFIRMILTDVKAVSEDEKNADSTRQIMKIISCTV